MRYLGDFNAGAVVRGLFNTRQANGTPITFAGTPALSVYKANSTTESTAGVSLTVDFDARTGLHIFSIDTSADGTFYSSGEDFRVVVTAGTVDSVSVVGHVVAVFSIANRSALRPTTAGRTLDVSAGGEAGIDWANVGSPTTTLNLSGTTISTSQAVASVSGSVGSVAGNVGGSVDSIAGVTFPTNFASLAITAGGAVTAGTVSDKTGYSLTQAFPSNFASLGINASGHISRVVLCDTTTTNTDMITASGIRSAVGLASANLDTQLTTIDDLLDTEVASIIASLSTIVGHVDTLETEVGKVIKSGESRTVARAGQTSITFTETRA